LVFELNRVGGCRLGRDLIAEYDFNVSADIGFKKNAIHSTQTMTAEIHPIASLRSRNRIQRSNRSVALQFISWVLLGRTVSSTIFCRF